MGHGWVQLELGSMRSAQSQAITQTWATFVSLLLVAFFWFGDQAKQRLNSGALLCHCFSLLSIGLETKPSNDTKVGHFCVIALRFFLLV